MGRLPILGAPERAIEFWKASRCCRSGATLPVETGRPPHHDAQKGAEVRSLLLPDKLKEIKTQLLPLAKQLREFLASRPRNPDA